MAALIVRYKLLPLDAPDLALPPVVLAAIAAHDPPTSHRAGTHEPVALTVAEIRH